MTELNTQLPTSGMLCGKSKWEVRKGKTGLGSHFWPTWYVIHDRSIVAKFDTWREALAYADQRARTREHVLPRHPLPMRVGKKTATLAPDGTLAFTRRDGSIAFTIHRKHWKPLALALLALHYQQEVPE